MQIEDLDGLIAAVLTDETNFGVQISLLNVLGDLQLPERVEEFVRPWFESRHAEEKHGAEILALYADVMLGMRRTEAKAVGADALRYVLALGLAADEDGIRAVDVANLAIFLGNNGHIAAAAQLHRLAYEWRPEASNIRGAYARFLLAVDDPQNANAVQQGQEVTIPAPTDESITRAFEEAPRYFSPGPYWWEQYSPPPRSQPLPALRA